MRIDPNTTMAQAAEGKSPTRTTPTRARRLADSQDEASLQGQVRVRTYQAEAIAGAEVRYDKVEALARAVRTGSYSVSSDEIATSIMSDMAANSGLLR